MPTFTFIARDNQGVQVNGTISAQDEKELREQLRFKDLYLIKVTRATGTAQQGSSSSLFRRKIGLGDLVILSRQFATLIRCGIHIAECLEMTAQQTDKAAMTTVLQSMRTDVLSGISLSSAMRKHPKVFPETYISLTEAGEVGGTLDKTLEIAAEQFDREAELREKVKAAFVYPTLVLITSFGVVTFMLIFIVPVFAKVYKQFKAELPINTQVLVTLSAFILHYWWAAILGVVALVFLAKRLTATEPGRKWLDGVKLRMPVLGKLNRKIAIARFCQTLAGASAGGVPILAAMTLAAKTTSNVVIIGAVAGVVRLIGEGATMAVPLAECGEFPPMVTHMIAAGEASGNLDEMLTEVAGFYERDIEYTVQGLTRILEPAMTVAVGGIVLFVLMALYAPIFNLTQVIKR